MSVQRGILRICLQCTQCVKVTRPKIVLKKQHVNSWGVPSWHTISTSSTLWDEKKQNVSEDLDIEKNPFFLKYKEKLKSLEQTFPEQYQEKLENLKEKMRLDQERLKEQMQKAEEEAKQKKPAALSWPPKSLYEVMKLDLIQDKSAEEIKEIWIEHHSKKEGVFAVLQDHEYANLMEKASLCPTFVYPIPRQDGFEFILSQFEGKHVYFTPLVMFQRLKENATPCLTIVHFTELQEEKGIVLMAGKYDNKLLSRKDALSLVRQMSVFYGKGAVESFNLVRIFNHVPEKFSYVDLLEEYKEMEKFLNAE